MHASSFENMARCLNLFMDESDVDVVDLGSMNVNGSYRSLMGSQVRYVGIDLEPGAGVDLVLTDVYKLPLENDSVDIVISGQMIEHCAHFWKVFAEIGRVLKPGGKAFIIAPSSGPIHRYPVDCYRFYPDAFEALADWSGLRLIQSWIDERGPWRDLTGVFQKGGDLQPVWEAQPQSVNQNNQQSPHPDPSVEVCRGSRSYLDVLRDFHDRLNPEFYLEIGVRKGTSLALARGNAIAIDPDPHPDFHILDERVAFYRCTSDDFFFFHRSAVTPGSINLAFIDGMHLAEFVLRDFMNVEQLMSPNGVIVIDDVLPNHPLQANRNRQSQAWTGDVWRFALMLSQHRPDLRLHWLDTHPTGLLVITHLDPENRTLWEAYNPIMRQLALTTDDAVPEEVLDRRNAMEPSAALLDEIFWL